MTQGEWEQQLDWRPFDFELRAKYADWLDGKNDDLAAAQRWMVRHQQRPAQDHGVNGKGEQFLTGRWYFPFDGNKTSFPSRHDAELALGWALSFPSEANVSEWAKALRRETDRVESEAAKRKSLPGVESPEWPKDA